VEEVKQELVRLLIILLHGLILEITTRSHETVDLVREPLNDVLGLDSLLPALHRLLVLILTRQHGIRDRDAGSIIRVDHCWVAGGSGLELRSLLRAQVHDLAAPAEADDTPLLDAGALGLDLGEDLGNALEGLGRSGGSIEELAELLAFLLRVRRVPGDVCWLAVEEIYANHLSVLPLPKGYYMAYRA